MKSENGDVVNHPGHYCKGGVECIDAIRGSMGADAFKGFLKGNVMKYIFRYEMKNGAEDLEKANWYLQRLIGEVKKDGENGVRKQDD